MTGIFVGGQPLNLWEMLGLALAKAETLFGPRDPAWTILGTGFSDSTPCISFPHTSPHHVLVCLTKDVDTPAQASFQLTHEVIHTLNPLRSPPASVLEEGIATWFSILISKKWFPDYPAEAFGMERYQQALELVKPLMVEPAQLRTWRADHPGQGFSDIGTEELQTLYPFLNADDAAQLTSRFSR